MITATGFFLFYFLFTMYIREFIWFTDLIVRQESFDDVAQTVDEVVQYDPEMAASRNIQFRIPHVPQHDRR